MDVCGSSSVSHQGLMTTSWHCWNRYGSQVPQIAQVLGCWSPVKSSTRPTRGMRQSHLHTLSLARRAVKSWCTEFNFHFTRITHSEICNLQYSEFCQHGRNKTSFPNELCLIIPRLSFWLLIHFTRTYRERNVFQRNHLWRWALKSRQVEMISITGMRLRELCFQGEQVCRCGVGWVRRPGVNPEAKLTFFADLNPQDDSFSGGSFTGQQ